MTNTTTTLPAGRELDALVAEKVMGWVRGRRYGNGNGEWIIDGKTSVSRTWDSTPSYSTSIAAAWEVVEKMRNTKEAPDETYWVLTDCAGSGWRAEILQVLTENDAPHQVAYGVGDTLPLAICLAALAALAPSGHSPSV